MKFVEPISAPATQNAETIYNKDNFKMLLEREADEATTVEGLLSLFLLQPVNGQKEQLGQEWLSEVTTQQTQTKGPNKLNGSDCLIGHLGDNTYGVVISGKGMVDSLQIMARIVNASPVPIVVGHSVFSIRGNQADHTIDLYRAAESALSLAKQQSVPKIVTLLREGQELDEEDLPDSIKSITTLIHT